MRSGFLLKTWRHLWTTLYIKIGFISIIIFCSGWSPWKDCMDDQWSREQGLVYIRDDPFHISSHRNTILQAKTSPKRLPWKEKEGWRVKNTNYLLHIPGTNTNTKISTHKCNIFCNKQLLTPLLQYNLYICTGNISDTIPSLYLKGMKVK